MCRALLHSEAAAPGWHRAAAHTCPERTCAQTAWPAAPRSGADGCQYLVRVSHLEVYNEEVRDLLGRDPKARLELREAPGRGVYARGLREYVVKSAEEMAAVLQVGRGCLGTRPQP